MESRRERLAKRAQESTINTSTDFVSINDMADDKMMEARRADAAFYRQVSKKRSAKYMECAMEKMRLNELKTKLLRELELSSKTQQADSSDNSDLSDINLSALLSNKGLSHNLPDDSTNKTNISNTSNDSSSISLSALLNKNDVEIKSEEPSLASLTPSKMDLSAVKKTTNFDKPTIDKALVYKQLQEINAKLEELNEQMLEEFPLGSRMLLMLYDGVFEEKLLEKGVIAAPGTAFTQEVQNAVLAECTPEEKEAIIWGSEVMNQAMMMTDRKVMFVEIYLELCCLVYEDGEVKVLRKC